MWLKYKDIDGDSNVESYEIGDDYISVRFHNGVKIYKYTYKTASKYYVEIMKKLANTGEGLNQYINTVCRGKYEK